MQIVYVGQDVSYREQFIKKWFLVDGEEWGLCWGGGEEQLLDCDGFPVEDCNDHDGIKKVLLDILFK